MPDIQEDYTPRRRFGITAPEPRFGQTSAQKYPFILAKQYPCRQITAAGVIILPTGLYLRVKSKPVGGQKFFYEFFCLGKLHVVKRL